MKKLLLFFLTGVLCLSLCACGGGKPAAEELIPGETVSIADTADFTLFKVTTTNRIASSLPGGLAYENNRAGETFVDVILDWTNASAEDVSSQEAVKVTAEGANGKYKDCLYAVEEADYEGVLEYTTLAPLTTSRLHCAVSVPEDETDLTVTLNVDGKAFSFEYTVGDVISTAEEISVGDTLKEEDYAEFVFNGFEYTDDLLPSDTSGPYQHYAVDSSSDTYLVVKGELTNLHTAAKDSDTFLGITATYQDKYVYTGEALVEDEDGRGFDSRESLDPLSVRSFFYLIELPESVTADDVVLTFTFNGKEFVYSE